MAFNTDTDKQQTAWVTVDNTLHKTGEKFTCRYCSTDKTKIDKQINIEGRNGKAVELTLPPGGLAIYEKVK